MSGYINEVLKFNFSHKLYNQVKKTIMLYLLI